jgi:hypothetical protein
VPWLLGGQGASRLQTFPVCRAGAQEAPQAGPRTLARLAAMRKRVPGATARLVATGRLVATLFLGIAVVADAPVERAIAEDDRRSVVRSVRRDGMLKVEAEGASVSDVIAALSRTEGFEVDGDAPGDGVRVTRSLEGTLDELLAKLLRDGNYVLITDEGLPKRLVILSAGRAAAPPHSSQPREAMSVEHLRQKESELHVLIARYEDMSEEAREHANPEFASRFKNYARKLSGEVDAIRARLATDASNTR